MPPQRVKNALANCEFLLLLLAPDHVLEHVLPHTQYAFTHPANELDFAKDARYFVCGSSFFVSKLLVLPINALGSNKRRGQRNGPKSGNRKCVYSLRANVICCNG